MSDESDTKNQASAQQAFLITYRLTASVTEGCRAAHISRQTAYVWRREDPEFAALWEEAQEIAVDDLEAAARQRALDGSDTLMIFLLKANRPDKYREVHRFEHSSTDDEALKQRAAALAVRIRELVSGDGETPALPAHDEPDEEV